jgi:hypothetical protein
MKRNVDESIYGVEGEFYVDGTGFAGQGHDNNIVDFNTPPTSQPSLWLQWIPTEDGNSIEWDGGEKFYCADDWILYLIDKVLEPRGYVLNGLVNAYGEERGDVWHIHIIDNQVSVGSGEKDLGTES